MPGARDTVRPHPLQRRLDRCVNLLGRDVRVQDGVMVVDGAVPDCPAQPPVLAQFRPRRAPEGEQGPRTGLLDSPHGIHA